MMAAPAAAPPLAVPPRDPVLRKHISNPDVLTLVAQAEPFDVLTQSESHVKFLVPKKDDAPPAGAAVQKAPPMPIHRYATESNIPTATRQRSESVPFQNAPISLEPELFADPPPVMESALERSAKRLGKHVKGNTDEMAQLGTTLTVVDDLVRSGTPQEIFIWMIGCTTRDEQFVETTTEFLNTYSYFMSAETLLQKLSECYFETIALQQRAERASSAASTPKANLSHLLARTISKGNVAAELRPAPQTLGMPLTPSGRSRTDVAASLVRTRSKRDLLNASFKEVQTLKPAAESGKLGASVSGANISAMLMQPPKTSTPPPPLGGGGGLLSGGGDEGAGAGLRGAMPPMLNLSSIRRHSNAGAQNPNVLSAKDRLNSSIVARSPRLLGGSDSKTPSPLTTPKDAFIGTDLADRALYVIEMWMEDHFLTFATNPNLLNQLGAFIHDVASASKRKPQGLKLEAFLRDSTLFHKINPINASARRFLLLSVGRLLRKSTPVKSMRKAFKKYKLTFKGSEACQWLAEKLQVRGDEACVLMQRMFKEGMIIHLEKDAVATTSSLTVPVLHPSALAAASVSANPNEPPNFLTEDVAVFRLTNAALDSEGGGSGIKGAERRVRKMDTFLDIEPEQAADALTAHEAFLLGLVPLNEFRHARDVLKILDGEKPPQTPPATHPNLFNLAVWVRKVRLWVITELTRANVTPKQRYDLLKRFLKTANRCLELKNLNAVHEIALGLQDPLVQKVPKLWDEVNQRAKYKDIAETLKRIFDPANDFYVYRPRVDLLQSPALFSFQIHLRDLALMDQGLPTFLSSTNLANPGGSNSVVNWSKMRSLSEELDWLQSFQSSALLYPFEQSRHFIAYIDALQLVEATHAEGDRKTVRVDASAKH